MLPYKAEKSVKKLQDALPLYQDKLGEPVVFKRFEEILNKVCCTTIWIRIMLMKFPTGPPGEQKGRRS